MGPLLPSSESRQSPCQPDHATWLCSVVCRSEQGEVEGQPTTTPHLPTPAPSLKMGVLLAQPSIQVLPQSSPVLAGLPA